MTLEWSSRHRDLHRGGSSVWRRFPRGEPRKKEKLLDCVVFCFWLFKQVSQKARFFFVWTEALFVSSRQGQKLSPSVSRDPESNTWLLLKTKNKTSQCPLSVGDYRLEEKIKKKQLKKNAHSASSEERKQCWKWFQSKQSTKRDYTITAEDNAVPRLVTYWVHETLSNNKVNTVWLLFYVPNSNSDSGLVVTKFKTTTDKRLTQVASVSIYNQKQTADWGLVSLITCSWLATTLGSASEERRWRLSRHLGDWTGPPFGLCVFFFFPTTINWHLPDSCWPLTRVPVAFWMCTLELYWIDFIFIFNKNCSKSTELAYRWTILLCCRLINERKRKDAIRFNQPMQYHADDWDAGDAVFAFRRSNLRLTLACPGQYW